MGKKGDVHEEDLSFEVLYETENWIAINKGAPLIVHPTDGGAQSSLLGGVEELLAYDIANGAKLSIVNRLDRETSGVVLIAKNKNHARLFGRAMMRKEFRKEYVAIVFGWPDWDERTVDAPLISQREVRESPIWLKQAVDASGKDSETRFSVKKRFTYHQGGEDHRLSYMHVKPVTGRMHQIRVHAAHMGHPLVGDKIYGSNEGYYLDFIKNGWSDVMAEGLLFRRHALHAERLILEGEDVLMDISAPLRRDISLFLDGKHL